MGCVLEDVTLPVAPCARVRPRAAWWWCGPARALRARSSKGLMCAQDRRRVRPSGKVEAHFAPNERVILKVRTSIQD